MVIVSWQAPHTLGRRLTEQKKEIRIFGETYHRRVKVVTINGFSAQAGQGLLLDYARATEDTLKQVFLVHGEPRGAEPLMEKLIQAGILEVRYPGMGDSFQL